MAVRPTDLDWESWLEGAAARYSAAGLSSTHDVSDEDLGVGPVKVNAPRKRLCVKTPSDAAVLGWWMVGLLMVAQGVAACQRKVKAIRRIRREALRTAAGVHLPVLRT